jgi:hypothetical protein
MTHIKLNRIVAVSVFAISMVVYAITLSPTVVFWDVGEFIAAAKLMQVPHPPGSPLFLLLARVAMMLPLAADQAVRAHALSAFLSALAIMFMYLVIVRTIVNYRGIPTTFTDRVAVLGSSVVGALALAFCSTYWDNSIEAEVYGASMFFLTTILWLVLRWMDKSDEPGNEKYILLISYLIGLSLGVHLLSLLAIFPVLMIIYFKKYEFTLNSFFKFSLIAVAIFFVVYPGIVKFLPEMMDGEWGGKQYAVLPYVPWLILAAAVYGAYVSYKKKQKMLNIALLAGILIFFGYTTYVSVLIRSNMNPPMNENDPSNLARLTSYLGREQYGNAPLIMPRRYSQEPHQMGIYTKYSSDMDFLWRYQLEHMFFRYVGWNFIGIAGEEQDSGVSFKDFFGIPLLLGLLGLYYQFRKDWKMGLVYLAAFVILGPVLALYQNQQEPQPRERDYFYVGAYAVFALWIAVGIEALIDFARSYLKKEDGAKYAAVGIVALAAVFVPVRMVQVNFKDHDRSGNYVAWDYSYNTLQSCEKDAILFTNGDNDTFPLWYLQDVEGVRRDVRIVNLSLVNTPWYIRQMKAKPYYSEALAVPISFSERQIEELQPVQWEARQMELPVPLEAFGRYGVTDTSVVKSGKVSFTMSPSLQVGQVKAIRVQDIMVLDIIRTNRWNRPVCFAVTCAPDSKIGLDDYMWFQGLVWRLEPRRISQNDLGMNPEVVEKHVMHEPEGFSTTPAFGYKFRNVANPKVFFDENTSRLMVNYRAAFTRLALYYTNVKFDPKKGIETLDRMEQIIPRSKIPLPWEIQADLSNLYFRFGQIDRFNEYSNELEVNMTELIKSGQANVNSYYNPYRVLLDIYDARKDYAKTLSLLKELQLQFPNDGGLKQRIEATQQQLAASTAKTKDSTQ